MSLKVWESHFCFSSLSPIEFNCLFFLNDRWKRFFFLLIVTWGWSYWTDLFLCPGTVSDSSDVLLFQRKKVALNHFLDSPQLIQSLTYLPSFSSTVQRAPVCDHWWKTVVLLVLPTCCIMAIARFFVWMQSFCSAYSDCWLHILCRKNSSGSLHLSL